ncbi:glycoside hydrolase family 31 protein [Autumnicola psychrophila]|uniref:Glycoside hydrolase family 31 protein n=1 Tax=Autumnicola psychrophila TaxID=3075592 RepID=A0ABU3DX68_9FLAO|nr:glycoside hydrolase family 31 protein [Zunongwangia sp. F225]MDT0688049.1 glycoside hydrolase family 31 protein [Zunongwangia sp. F225]
MIVNTELETKGNLFPGEVKVFEFDGNSVTFSTANNVLLRITVLRDSILRFRYATDGIFENDFSYAIDKDTMHGFNKFEIQEAPFLITIITSKIKCKISTTDLKIGIYDLQDNVIVEEELGFHWEESFKYGGNFVKMNKTSVEGENFFGLGDKPTNFNLKGRKLTLWNKDQFAFNKDLDELYKSVPFYTALHSNMAYGIFFDNSFRTHFDFCQDKRNEVKFWAEGGEMNYYFIYGPKIAEVVTSYTNLTGTPDLPPLWALGYHQSKWSYFPEERVTELAAKFRELEFPCDAIHLDIDYMDDFKCFTWNNKHFPDPKLMVENLEEKGFKTVVIIDPGIKIDADYKIFKEALDNNYFCRRADGPFMRGKVWPGECYFPDFTNPKVREWWAGLFKELVGEIGVKGVWNDMNEPAVMEVPGKTFPTDVRHNYDGNDCSHRKAHNIYGMQMARATHDGVRKYAFPKRPFTMTRANFAGGQRYCATWTGDNIATWEHLWLANTQVQRLCLSGMSFTGSDIGGFAEQPSGELFTRWIQLGIFHPFCRVHSSGDHGNQEPWSFGEEVLSITREYVRLRYQLLPYLYTAFYQYTEEGIPILKPLVYFDQEDVHTYYRSDEFIFGNQILVCPIQDAHVQGRRVYFPRGKWYNFWNDEIVTGGKEYWVDAPLEKSPIFIKEGAIIPKFPVQNYVDEIEIKALFLDIYYKNGNETSILYEDAHDGYDYKKGRYSLKTFKFRGKPGEIIIQQHKDGKFLTSYKHLEVRIHGLPFEIEKAYLDNEEVSLETLDFDPTVNTMKIPKVFDLIQFTSKAKS